MVNIRPYSDKYKEQTVRLLLSVLEDEFEYKGLERPDLDNISNAYQVNHGNFWIALNDDELIGTIALQDHGKGRGFVRRMCVKKKYRRKGIGQKLFDTLLGFARNSTYKTIYCSTVVEFKSARAFYEKNNFSEIKELPEDMALPIENVFLELKL